jgi:hypothetical protein
MYDRDRMRSVKSDPRSGAGPGRDRRPKGHETASAQRQYTGTAGRIENAQAAVLLTHSGRRGAHCATGGSTCHSP